MTASIGMRGVLAISSSTFAIITVSALVGVFVVMLLGTLVRARKAHGDLAAAGERPGGAARTTPAPASPKAAVVVSRRDFFRGGLLASLGVFAAEFGFATIAMLWPNLKGGFGSVILIPDTLDSVKGQIASTRQPYYFGAGRFYLINYTGDGTKAGGIYDGITSQGLMALYQKCAHLGCRVPFCEASQWFECPCHGSKYNYAGEYQLGPAPTGLSRFAVTTSGSTISVDTSTIIPGPPRGTNTIHQSPEGPFCVGGAA
jgi:cytochrome b6-f complex iron-sulfur subunit